MFAEIWYFYSKIQINLLLKIVYHACCNFCTCRPLLIFSSLEAEFLLEEVKNTNSKKSPFTFVLKISLVNTYIWSFEDVWWSSILQSHSSIVWSRRSVRWGAFTRPKSPSKLAYVWDWCWAIQEWNNKQNFLCDLRQWKACSKDIWTWNWKTHQPWHRTEEFCYPEQRRHWTMYLCAVLQWNHMWLFTWRMSNDWNNSPPVYRKKNLRENGKDASNQSSIANRKLRRYVWANHSFLQD